jgi:mRNA-degrading endonuclease HigB of HigAB toxin-antitoxin module
MMPMQVMALRALRDFWATHPQAEMPMRAWYLLIAQMAGV